MEISPNWNCLCKLGAGSTGTVYLASDPVSGRLFAIKSAEVFDSSPLQHEFGILSSLDSPYIISSLGTNETSSHYHLFLDFAPNGSLYNLINGHMEEQSVRLYTRDILLGLQYLHSNSVVHCDIKSQNILIGSDGHAKISDFGSAILKSGIESGNNTSFSGTPAFMAPEVARGEEIGTEADMWALGCTVIEMATGKCPWSNVMKDQDLMSAIYRIGFCSESMLEIPDWFSEEGKDFLRKCLTRDPKERWSAEMLIDHPFVCSKREGEQDSGSTFTPQSALDFGIVFSESETEEEEEEVEEDETDPGNRIRELVSGFGCFELDWDENEEDWIEVRKSDEEGNRIRELVSGFGSFKLDWDENEEDWIEVRKSDEEGNKDQVSLFDLVGNNNNNNNSDNNNNNNKNEERNRIRELVSGFGELNWDEEDWIVVRRSDEEGTEEQVNDNSDYLLSHFMNIFENIYEKRDFCVSVSAFDGCKTGSINKNFNVG